MEFRRRKRSEIGIDMTPMIDCVFQLLIFFLLSSSFLSPAVKLKLPKVPSEGSTAQEAVVVTVDADNRWFLNTAPVERGRLRERLQAELHKTGKREVMLKADGALPYEKVLDALVTIRRAGGTEVLLVHEAEKNP